MTLPGNVCVRLRSKSCKLKSKPLLPFNVVHNSQQGLAFIVSCFVLLVRELHISGQSYFTGPVLLTQQVCRKRKSRLRSKPAF